MRYIEDEDGWSRYAFSPGERPVLYMRQRVLAQRFHRSGWVLQREANGNLWILGSGGPHRNLGPITLTEGKRQVRAEALAEWGIKHPEDVFADRIRRWVATQPDIKEHVLRLLRVEEERLVDFLRTGRYAMGKMRPRNAEEAIEGQAQLRGVRAALRLLEDAPEPS